MKIIFIFRHRRIKTSEWGAILVGALLLAVCSPDLTIGEGPTETYEIKGAKYLFGLSASPEGARLLVYANTSGDLGEVVSGRPVLLNGKDLFSVKWLDTGTAMEGPAGTSVWSKDGSHAYFNTDGGVFVLSPKDDGTEQIIKGHTLAGLALSCNEKLIAFWRLGRGAHELIVYDLTTRKQIRSWRLQSNYDSDQTYFDLAFNPDDRSLLGRTYDTEGRTPLKEFSLETGRVRFVASDLASMAGTSHGIYYAVPRLSGKGYRLLKYVSPRSETVLGTFDYNDLAATGGGYIVCRFLGQKKVQPRLLDLNRGTLGPLLPSNCEEAAVLPDGTILCTSGGSIFTVPVLSPAGIHK